MTDEPDQTPHITAKKRRTYQQLSLGELRSVLRYYYNKDRRNLPPDLVAAVQMHSPDWTPAAGYHFKTDNTKHHIGNTIKQRKVQVLQVNPDTMLPQTKTMSLEQVRHQSLETTRRRSAAINTVMSVGIVPQTPNKTGIMYNVVTVNDIPVVINHRETELKTFLDGQYLGIYGIQAGQTTPSWIVFDTTMRQRPVEAIVDSSVRVEKLFETADNLRLVMHAGISVMLARKENCVSQFKIEHTR